MYDVEITLRECIKDIERGISLNYIPKPYIKTDNVYDLCNLICKNSKLNEQESRVTTLTEEEVDNVLYHQTMVFIRTIDFIRCLSQPYHQTTKNRVDSSWGEGTGASIYHAWQRFTPTGVKAWYLHCLDRLLKSFVDYRNFVNHKII